MPKVIIKKLTDDEINKLGVKTWPIWQKEVSRFDWEYDTEESCLILEGEFRVETEEGDYSVEAGDFVTFREGLKCTWDIGKPVRKHYMFK